MKVDKRTAAMILKCIALDNKDRLDIKSAIAIALEGLENLPDEVTVETCGGDEEEVAENAPTVSHWVKTDDRMPDDDEPVLVTYVGYADNLPHNDAIAVYAHEITDNYAGAWYWQDSDGVDDNPVSVAITHWMPIPPLPEVEG